MVVLITLSTYSKHLPKYVHLHLFKEMFAVRHLIRLGSLGSPQNMELGKRRTDDAERLLTEKKNKKYNKYMKNNVRLNIVFWIKSLNIFASFIYRKSKENLTFQGLPVIRGTHRDFRLKGGRNYCKR